MARRLSPLEIDAYAGVVDRSRVTETKVVNVPKVPGRFIGITLGRYVFVTPGHDNGDGTSQLLAHELVHVEQWKRLGAARFLRSYLGSYLGGLRSGLSPLEAYAAIPLEREARERAASWAK